ncbi:MAG: hypothetical protein CM15mP18_0420 [Methanobacteriota archaeon]|nr:MAG: hypothetical protein CM15mP18_0420 [Euryarchaeota archaeon]
MPPTDAMKRRQAWESLRLRAATRRSIHQSPYRRAKACARRLCVPSSPLMSTVHTPVCSPRTKIRPQRLLSRRAQTAPSNDAQDPAAGGDGDA